MEVLNIFFSMGMLLAVITVFGVKLILLIFDYVLYIHQSKKYHIILLPLQLTFLIMLEYNYATRLMLVDMDYITSGHLSIFVDKYIDVAILFGIVNVTTFYVTKQYERYF